MGMLARLLGLCFVVACSSAAIDSNTNCTKHDDCPTGSFCFAKPDDAVPVGAKLSCAPCEECEEHMDAVDGECPCGPASRAQATANEVVEEDAAAAVASQQAAFRTEKDEKAHIADIQEHDRSRKDAFDVENENCGSYCENACCQFAHGLDTHLECNACDAHKACNPRAKGYGLAWHPCEGNVQFKESAKRHVEL